MTRKTRFAVSIVGALLLLIVAPSVWLGLRHSMSIVTSFDMGSPSAVKRVLIATQGSEYKNALVERIVDRLRPHSPYIHVIDVTELPTINETDWNAVVVIHTWQIGRPEQHVSAFASRVLDKKKLIAITTSASGRETLPGVDAISSASKLEDVTIRAQEIVARLDRILATTQ